MKALIYLTKRSFINHMKQAVKKPMTLIALIFGIAYGIFIIVMLGSLALSIHINSPKGLLALLIVWSIYGILGNFMSYSSRKGILFRPGHAHFVFTAPLSPKLVLLGSAWVNYTVSVLIWAVIGICAFTVFGITVWQALLLVLFGCVLELVFEAAVIIFLYTNDHLPGKLMKGIRFGIKIFMIAFAAAVVVYFRREGISAESVQQFVDLDALQMIPVMGWQIAAYRLILFGPSVLNTICALLYVLLVVVSVSAAVRMKCDGGYYEEAAKFADDYAELKKRQKSGEMVWGLNEKKRKFRRVRERFSGKGARAVFQRQLLEYQKERFFFLDKITLLSFVLAAVFSYGLTDEAVNSGAASLFLLAVVAYMSLVMSGYSGKWESELKNPYIFLIPDTSLRKMWYASLTEHLKALVNGIIICVPVGIFWRVRPEQIVYCILIYVVIMADRLYTMVIAQCLFGEIFGKTGQNILRMCIQMAVLGTGAGIAALAGIFVNVDLIFPIVLIYSMIVTVATGIVASLRLETMEQM